MRICLICDFRSPHPRNWIGHLVRNGHEVHVISSYPCGAEDLGAASVRVVPISFSWLSRPFQTSHRVENAAAGRRPSLVSSVLRRVRTSRLTILARSVMFWVAPLELIVHRRRVRELIQSIRPDLVHAMRIPFE